MRYTEKDLVRPGFSDKSSLVKYFVSNVVVAPYRLCREISNKFLYLQVGEVLKVFRCAAVVNVLLVLPDVYRMVSYRTPLAGGAGVIAKVASLAGLVSLGVVYRNKASNLVEIQLPEEEVIIPKVEKIEDIEIREAEMPEEEEIDLSELLEESSSVSEDELELSRQIGHGLVDTMVYPSTEAKDLLNSKELSYAARMAFSLEKDFMNLSSELSIEEIGAQMYSDPDVEYGEEDEALSFQGIEDLLMI